MNMREPNFINSSYFYWNNDGLTVRERMKLLPSAPNSISEEYEDYISQYKEFEQQQGIDINEELPLVIRIEDIE